MLVSEKPIKDEHNIIARSVLVTEQIDGMSASEFAKDETLLAEEKTERLHEAGYEAITLGILSGDHDRVGAGNVIVKRKEAKGSGIAHIDFECIFDWKRFNTEYFIERITYDMLDKQPLLERHIVLNNLTKAAKLLNEDTQCFNQLQKRRILGAIDKSLPVVKSSPFLNGPCI